MPKSDQLMRQAAQLVRSFTSDTQRQRLTRRKQRAQLIIKRILLLIVASALLVPLMIAGGFLFGPRGTEGLIAAPLLLMLMWSSVLYLTFRRRPRPRQRARADLSQLPESTGNWIEQERSHLPTSAQAQLDSIQGKVDALAAQVRGLPADGEPGGELRRLLMYDLPDLVEGYRKVPRALAKQPLYDGPSPEKQLTDGLDIIDKQLGRLHERLAKEDLHALATHQRYLQLKYERDDEKR